MQPTIRPLLAIALALTASSTAFAVEALHAAASPVSTTGLDAAPATTTAALTWPSEKVDDWHGFQRHFFKVDGCDCWVVEPKRAAAGNPWTWCMENPDAFVERTGVPQLLEKGFYHLFCSGGDTCGSPESMKHYNAFYQFIAAKGLAQKGTLIGISRGGFVAYRWAALNTDKIACIYGDAPVCDFKPRQQNLCVEGGSGSAPSV